jgi:FMN phosphatase YigB (HAD superfamily)
MSYWEGVALKLGWPVELLKRKVLQTFPNNNRLLELIQQLSENYTTVLMSNQIEGWIEEVLKPKKISDYFHHSFNSYQTGLSKPDSHAFISIMKELDGEPHDFIFIDDQEKNVVAAAKLDMITIHFSSEISLEKELEKLGISPFIKR